MILGRGLVEELEVEGTDFKCLGWNFSALLLMQQLITGEQNPAAHGSAPPSTAAHLLKEAADKKREILPAHMHSGCHRVGCSCPGWLQHSHHTWVQTVRIMCPAAGFSLFLRTLPYEEQKCQHLREVPGSELLLAIDAEEVLRVTCLPQDGHNLPGDGLLAGLLATVETPSLFQSD